MIDPASMIGSLQWAYLAYELCIGFPLLFYLRYKKHEVWTGAMPRPLRYFPIAGWIFRRWTDPALSQSGIRRFLPEIGPPGSRVKINVGPGLILVLIYAVGGFLLLFWFMVEIGNDSFATDTWFDGFVNFFMLLVWAGIGLLYMLLLLVLFFVFVYHPARKRTEAELMQKLWDARNPKPAPPEDKE